MTSITKILFCIGTSLLLGSCTNDMAHDDKMLLVLNAPSIHNEYYAPAFDEIINFQIGYANAILGNDNVVILTDADTKAYFEGKVPDEILLAADIHDIWMRDFTTVDPINSVQFKYTWASMKKEESKEVQNSFNRFADQFGIERDHSEFMIDGGNIVDNYAGSFITTSRFLEDNNLGYEKGKDILKNILNAKSVAIIEPDEEGLAHSDGMVMWADENTLLVNDYSEDPEFREMVLDELKHSFPEVEMIEVPVAYTENTPGEWTGFSSACGVNLNATVTFNNIYVPTFGMPHEDVALEVIRNNTSKKVIEVDARGVCKMGGSVRCLTWQTTGANAQKIIEAAKQQSQE